MLEVISYIGAGIALVIAGTFVIAIAKTLFEGVESFAAFDRAGFTLGNYIRGTLPRDAASESHIIIGESAEIETLDGGFWAAETRTVVKHQS